MHVQIMCIYIYEHMGRAGLCMGYGGIYGVMWVKVLMEPLQKEGAWLGVFWVKCRLR